MSSKKSQTTQWKVQSTFVPVSSKQHQSLSTSSGTLSTTTSSTTTQSLPQSQSPSLHKKSDTPPTTTIISPTPMPASFSGFSAFTPPSDPNKTVHRSVSPHIIQQKYPKGQKPMASLGIHEDMRKALLRRAYALARFPAPEDPRVVGLPAVLHRYVGVFRMDAVPARKEQVFEFSTMCFRAMSSVDGDIYTIRQVTNIKSFTEPMKLMADRWEKLSHPAIVSVKDLFISSEIGEISSLFVVYNFIPCVETLESMVQGPTHPTIFTEHMLWRMSTQLLSALKHVHENSLVCGRALHPSKILISNLCGEQHRFYINCCGLADVVSGVPPKDDGLAVEDLKALGRLVLVAALGDPAAFYEKDASGLEKSIELLNGQFSPYFVSFVKYLVGLGEDGTTPSVNEATTILAPILISELSSAYTFIDTVVSELEKELQNGRLFRLLSKLNFVVQRPETFRDPSWQAHGGSHLLNIFCDYVFMSDSDDPTDLAHVVSCLNKLDAGSPEKLMLISRDNQDCYVVSYLELKNLLDKTFMQMK